jgi:hypothetical protein
MCKKEYEILKSFYIHLQFMGMKERTMFIGISQYSFCVHTTIQLYI